MTEITDLVGDATVLWGAIMTLTVVIIGFLVGKRLFRKVG